MCQATFLYVSNNTWLKYRLNKFKNWFVSCLIFINEIIKLFCKQFYDKMCNFQFR